MGKVVQLSYCTTRDAAKVLGVTLRTVQLWVDSGILEAWKTEGGHRRVSVASVEHLADTGIPSAKPHDEPEVRFKILVVEDDMALLKLYKMRMACWNLPLDITLAHNGYEALMHVGRDSPDMFISDLCMPGIDGLQMLRNLSTSRFREGMEIVVVTGMNPADLAGMGGLPPSVRCFYKPLPFADLCLLTEQLLARRAEV